MKIYVFYTPSHESLYRDWFLPSLKDDYEFVVKRYEQRSLSGDFMDKGWIETMHAKVDLILEGIRDNMGEVFVHADVDIQFFKPTIKILSRLIEGKDFVVQRDNPQGVACAGFFACRANKKTLQLWLDIKENLGKNNLHDQDLLNTYLGTYQQRWLQGKLFQLGEKLHSVALQKAVSLINSMVKNLHQIKWAYLPDEFMSGGTLTGKLWNPGQFLKVPSQIILHHANWTVGVENKVAQLRYVRDRWNANHAN